MVKFKEMIEDLEKLKTSYGKIKLLLEDQIHDDQIKEAEETFQELLALKNSIETMENLEIDSHHTSGAVINKDN